MECDSQFCLPLPPFPSPVLICDQSEVKGGGRKGKQNGRVRLRSTADRVLKLEIICLERLCGLCAGFSYSKPAMTGKQEKGKHDLFEADFRKMLADFEMCPHSPCGFVVVVKTCNTDEFDVTLRPPPPFPICSVFLVCFY